MPLNPDIITTTASQAKQKPKIKVEKTLQPTKKNTKVNLHLFFFIFKIQHSEVINVHFK